MKLSNYVYLFISILLSIAIYSAVTYPHRILDLKFISSIGSLFIAFLITYNFQPKSNLLKIVNLLLVGITFFYSSMIIGSKMLFINHLQNARKEIEAQASVKFEHSSFKEGLNKAKKENKLIFLDIYTGWCGPCLYFSKTVLKNEKIASILNRRFINMKYDAEVSEGIEVNKKYGKGYFPTILILNSDGTIKEDVCKDKIPNSEEFEEILKKYN